MITASNSIKFKPFDDCGELRYYQSGYLPHLRQPGCAYFVTFRLADSIPAGRLNQWRQERVHWLNMRGIDVRAPNWNRQFWKLSEADRIVYERNFASKLFEALDEGMGDNCLKISAVQNIVVSALKHFDGDRVLLGDFVVMPNHVHALMMPLDGFVLEAILHSIKSWSSNQINKLLSRKGALWMKDSFDRLVRDGDELLRTQEYIRRNPQKANLNDGEYYVETKEFVFGF